MVNFNPNIITVRKEGNFKLIKSGHTHIRCSLECSDEFPLLELSYKNYWFGWLFKKLNIFNLYYFINNHWYIIEHNGQTYTYHPIKTDNELNASVAKLYEFAISTK